MVVRHHKRMSNIIKQIERILLCYLSCDRKRSKRESKYKNKIDWRDLICFWEVVSCLFSLWCVCSICVFCT